MSRRHVGTVAGLALAFVGSSAPAHAATSVAASSQSPTHARAYGGRVVWGELGELGWQLRTLEAGQPADLPIAPFKSDGALDVGPGEDGAPTLVFSRCTRTAEGGTTGCDVFRYDFATRTESPVGTVNTPGAIETLPSIWGRRIAFMRRVPRRTRPTLHIAPTRGTGRVVRAARGGTIVKSVTLAREGLFYVSITSGGGRSAQTLYRVRHGRRTTIERTRYHFPSQAGNVGPPAVAGGRVYFSLALPRGRVKARSVLVRESLRSGRRSVATPPRPFRSPGSVGAIMPFGRGFLLEAFPFSNGPGLEDGGCNPGDPCTLLRATGLRWRPATA
jgi:hypothetical protein